MQTTLSYLGHSQLRQRGAESLLAFAPDHRRAAVAFDAELRHPLRFREAVSALHAVVTSDLRFQKRDRSAYLEWKKGEQLRRIALSEELMAEARREALRAHGISHEFEEEHRQLVHRYWHARNLLSGQLRREDPTLWRKLFPLDPIITVADDVVFFECFSADESSYGCLTVDRERGFSAAHGLELGTTNVDYSYDLFDGFQRLRSYNTTRLLVDPGGFTVRTDDAEEVREEKIDLPDSWLRGFLQLQSAMSLPMRCVSLSREAVYSILAWHQRRRAKKSPRALRFELVHGNAPRVVLEPWERGVTSTATRYHGPDDTVRIWGARRLRVLARTLPLAERVDVYLLGNGLPSFWVVRMGEMRLTVGLSGWTANDWTKGSALEAIAPVAEPDRRTVDQVTRILRDRGSMGFTALQATSGAGSAETAAALAQLARTGRAIYDLDAGLFRWRQVLDRPVAPGELADDNPERTESMRILASGRAREKGREDAGAGRVRVRGSVDRSDIEVVLDADGRIKSGRCDCSHHFRAGIRRGPCRHLLALRAVALNDDNRARGGGKDWYDRLLGWAAT